MSVKINVRKSKDNTDKESKDTNPWPSLQIQQSNSNRKRNTANQVIDAK